MPYHREGAYDGFDRLAEVAPYYKRCRKMKCFILSDAGVMAEKPVCSLCRKPVTVKRGNMAEWQVVGDALRLFVERSFGQNRDVIGVTVPRGIMAEMYVVRFATGEYFGAGCTGVSSAVDASKWTREEARDVAGRLRPLGTVLRYTEEVVQGRFSLTEVIGHCTKADNFNT